MKIKHIGIFSTAFLALAAFQSARAAIITVSTDPIGGGNLSGTTFTIGSVGGGPNQFPAAETPPNAIDGASGTKYLNHTATNSGYIVTPAVGPSDVTGISFTTANDTPARDPASYTLYGSNTVTASATAATTYNLASFAQISTGALALSNNRFDSSVSVSFANPTSYNTYLLVFPTVKDSTDGNMQIADAILTGTATPEPACLSLMAIGGIGLLLRRRSV